MIINGSNVVNGLYNYDKVPSGTIFTEGDLVLDNNTLYTCISQTSNEPNVNDPSWEYYLAGVKTADNISDFSDTGLQSTLVSMSGISDFLNNYWAGMNHDGSIKLLNDLSDGELDTLMANSSFQLSFNYLNQIANDLPFTPSDKRVYVVRTTGDISSGSVINPSIFTQEIIEYKSDGYYYSWVRSGINLSSAPWQPTKGESFNNSYVSYIYNAVNKYEQGKTLYNNFIQDVNNGEYKFWKIKDYISGDILFDETEFSKDKYYKVILHTTNNPSNISNSISIDIIPEDHLIPEDSTISYTSGDEVKLTRDSSPDTTLSVDESKLVIKSIRESNNINL